MRTEPRIVKRRFRFDKALSEEHWLTKPIKSRTATLSWTEPLLMIASRDRLKGESPKVTEFP